MYRPVSDTWPDYMKVEGNVNTVGPLAVGVPGTLRTWCEVLERFGTLDLDSVLQPAVRHAERGFRATPYLVEAIAETAADLARFPASARTYLPGGAPLKPGDVVRQPEYAETLRAVGREGAGLLYGGALGTAIVDHLCAAGGIVALDDLRTYRTVEREPIRGRYRGWEIVGPPPPSAGGIHVVEMLNVLEGFDVAGLGFGTAESFHLIAEVLKIGFADRDASTGDPDFLDIPVARLISKEYAAIRRGEIDPARAGRYAAGPPLPESAHTTHVTTADADGNLVAMTQTLNNLFGSRLTVPGTGVMLNNNMALFDPHPGRPNSVAPGKRMRSSMAPTIVARDGRPVLAVGLPGGVRISTSVMQALVNFIDHGMSPQEMVEAPRVWTQGQDLEIETRVPEAIRAAVAAMGHPVLPVSTVGGGMNAIAVGEDGGLTGAACWRADGTPIGVSGGLARPGIRFHPNPERPSAG
jgi:gamma-glutamyltranspeptidase / glutathione hydrolase